LVQIFPLVVRRRQRKTQSQAEMSLKHHPASRVDAAVAERLYREAKAERWRLPQAAFTAALETSCAKAFSGGEPTARELSRYLDALHLEDLALACACAVGDGGAWDHFVLEMRPGLYRAADALDPSGAARELADSLYGDLYGLDHRGGARQSLLRYFHGRSSLATWLRAVLAQRHVDRVRVDRRTEPLPDELPASLSRAAPDPECAGLVEMLRLALGVALGRLDPRDRLRLACYYAQQLTLSQTGKLLKEHEATTSRQLARTRKRVREAVEQDLRSGGLNDAQIVRCFECAVEDVGATSLDEMLDVRSG
jgi:RNA polymerase sigma factor (sigma-70 family)